MAPAALTVDLHSADHRNSFLYVFDYQTKFGDYPQVKLNARNLLFHSMFTYLWAELYLRTQRQPAYEFDFLTLRNHFVCEVEKGIESVF